MMKTVVMLGFLFALPLLSSTARADGLDPAALVEKLPFKFTVEEKKGFASKDIDDPKAVARRYVELTSKRGREAPLVYTITMVTYPTEEAAKARRDQLEQLMNATAPEFALGKGFELYFVKGPMLVKASATCTISNRYVETINKRLIQQLGPISIAPIHCVCGGHCELQK